MFAEFWGPNSFAGQHVADDPKRLILFDICPDKKGIAGPGTFLKLCGHLPIPAYFGEVNWTRAFVESVRNGTWEHSKDLMFEGVVGKGGEGHKLVMAKVKTQAWINAVYKRYGLDEGKRIVES